MGRLIRITNPDGTVTFKDSKTGEMVNPKQNSSSLSMWLSALGIIYFIASIILSIIIFSNSSIRLNSILGEVNKTNPIAIATGINILFQGLIIMLICLALAKILDIVNKGYNKE